jgi:tetratricopeptide (TPR) repeat protein
LPLDALDRDVPREIERLIRACLAKTREERRLAAHEIADRLCAIAASIGARPAADVNRVHVKRQAWRAAVLVAAAAVVAAAVSGTQQLIPRLFNGTRTTAARANDKSGVMTTRLRSVTAPMRPVSGVDRDLAEVTTASLEAYRVYAEGVNLHERGRDVEAVTQLRRAVRIDPTFAMALAKLAIAEASGGVMDMAAAHRHSRQAYEQSQGLPDRERLYIEAVYHRHRGDVAGSIDSLQKVLALDPNHISSRQTLAATFQEQERFREAAAHYEELRRRGVPLGISYFGLSQTYQALGEFDKAIEVVQEFLHRNPDDARGYRRLGEALVAAGRFDDAAQAVERADGLGLRPSERDDLRRTILVLQDRVTEAEAIDRAKLKSGDTSLKHSDSFRLASDLLLRGRTADARKIFAGTGARYWVALLWLEEGDAARALVEIRRGQSINDTLGPETLSLVARAHARLGQRAEAALAVGLMSTPTNGLTTPWGDRRVRLARGLAALELNDVATAILELRAAAGLLPPNPMERGMPILYALGCAYLAAGRDANAAATFERLVANSARASAPVEFVRSLYFLGQIAAR